MMTSLSHYIHSFLNPIDDSEPSKRVGYYELLGISWILHIIYALYSMAAIYLGAKTYEYLSDSSTFTDIITSSFSTQLQRYNIFSIVFQVLLYPFIFQFGFKFWTYLLNFFADLYNVKKDEAYEDKIKELVSSMFTTNILLLLPVFGSVLSSLTQAFYLFIGSTKKLGFTKLQAILVLVSPLFIVLLLTTLVIAYYTFLIKIIL